MSLLDNPKAKALLADANVSTNTIRALTQRLTTFLQRYHPLFYREEQRGNATLVIEGKLSGLERKTCEPIATEAGVQRKPVQHFVGAGKWDDERVMAAVRCQVAEELGAPQGVLALDGSGFPKKGPESCGVGRQWCGRLGKVDNCQVGVFLGYIVGGQYAPLDRRLYLPEDWASDRRRRTKTHVPKEIKFQEKWRMGLDLIERSGPSVPHQWVTADDEFGRVTEFRATLRFRHERYVLDVPSNTLVREVSGGPRGSFQPADAWAAQQPAERWKTLNLRGGEQGPRTCRVLKRRVQTKDAEGLLGPSETLLVMRAADGKLSYSLSNAPRATKVTLLAQVKADHHPVEQMFQEGKGEVGLDHYEVRSWVGWHHHMTLSLLALWFLVWERRQVQKKRPRLPYRNCG